jgi:hypothetical protein
MLFNEKNLCDEHCYKLDYVDHDETEFVYALNLTPPSSNKDRYSSTFSLNDVLSLFQQEELQVIRKYNHPVTYLHAAMSQFNLFYQYRTIGVTSPQL